MLGDGQLRGTIVDHTNPLSSRYPRGSMQAEVIGYHYVGGAHGSYRKLTLNVEITSATERGAALRSGGSRDRHAL